jgi:hypothetical protein
VSAVDGPLDALREALHQENASGEHGSEGRCEPCDRLVRGLDRCVANDRRGGTDDFERLAIAAAAMVCSLVYEATEGDASMRDATFGMGVALAKAERIDELSREQALTLVSVALGLKKGP